MSEHDIDDWVPLEHAVTIANSDARLSRHVAKVISDEAGAGRGPVCKLNKPMSVTVKDARGQYKKIAASGDETFKLTAAYVGKRETLILVFQPLVLTAAKSYRFMELDATEAIKHLDGVAEYLSAVAAKAMQPEIEAAKEEAAAARKREVEAYGESEYGTW